MAFEDVVQEHLEILRQESGPTQLSCSIPSSFHRWPQASQLQLKVESKAEFESGVESRL
jgi:hypothetical protein